MNLVDLTPHARAWLAAPPGDGRREAYVQAQRDCEPWSIAAWEMSGREFLQLDADLERMIQEPDRGLGEGRAQRIAAECARNGQEAFARCTGLDASPVVLLAGCFGSNALQASSPEGFAAILCVEHVAPCALGLGMSEPQATAWTVHELAHCARYSLPGTASPVAAFPRGHAGFRGRLDSLPLAERLVDEGIASALQLEAVSRRHEASLLHFSDADHRWALENAPSLLTGLARQADEDPSPRSGHASRMLYMFEDEQDEPSRWSYPVGAEIARRARRAGLGWEELLAAPAGAILLAAAEESRDEWSEPLRRLASTS